jgi:hypothetical protein
MAMSTLPAFTAENCLPAAVYTAVESAESLLFLVLDKLEIILHG